MNDNLQAVLSILEGATIWILLKALLIIGRNRRENERQQSASQVISDELQRNYGHAKFGHQWRKQDWLFYDAATGKTVEVDHPKEPWPPTE